MNTEYQRLEKILSKLAKVPLKKWRQLNPGVISTNLRNLDFSISYDSRNVRSGGEGGQPKIITTQYMVQLSIIDEIGKPIEVYRDTTDSDPYTAWVPIPKETALPAFYRQLIGKISAFSDRKSQAQEKKRISVGRKRLDTLLKR